MAVEATVSAGSMRASGNEVVTFAHGWTGGGVTVEAEFTGGHLLHLAVAGCVLNDLCREAADMRISLNGVRVRAAGGFDTSTWASTEIPRAIRQGATVRRGR